MGSTSMMCRTFCKPEPLFFFFGQLVQEIHMRPQVWVKRQEVMQHEQERWAFAALAQVTYVSLLELLELT